MIHTNYLRNSLDKDLLKKNLAWAITTMKKSKLDFDSIAVTGVSGLTFGSILAHRLNKNLIVVRKQTELTHSWCDIEGEKTGKKYIIVDDQISSGDTVKSIITRLRDHLSFEKMNCVGLYLYVHANPGMLSFALWERKVPSKQFYKNLWILKGQDFLDTLKGIEENKRKSRESREAEQ